MQAPDYPAAHSMDAEWFAIDEAGEVAKMGTGISAPMPLNLPMQCSIYELFEHLEKDEYGLPVLPLHYDPFAHGNHNQVVEQALAALSHPHRAELQALAHTPKLSDEDREKFNICREDRSVIVLLAAPADILLFREHCPWDDDIRLDKNRGLYYIHYSFHLIDCVRLWLQGRLIAIHIVEHEFDFGKNRCELGIYTFEVSHAKNEGEQKSGICPHIYAPQAYEKVVTPTIPRRELPLSLLAAKSQYEWDEEMVSGPLIHFLPGVRFAKMDFVQIADKIGCYDWNHGSFQPQHGTVIIQQNMFIAHQENILARQSHITQWHATAEQGDMLAQYSLGYLYCESAERDLAQAEYWFEKAAQQGETARGASDDIFENGVAAQYCFAELLYHRLSTETNPAPDEIAQMQHCYQCAAARDYSDAQFRLGWCMARGELIELDLVCAKFWLEQAADQGHERAKAMLQELDQTATS